MLNCQIKLDRLSLGVAMSSGQVVALDVQDTPQQIQCLDSGWSASVVVPPAPSEYRHLRDSYSSIEVSSWAERRVCDITGGHLRYLAKIGV
jgi:hypothetical protein